MMSSSSASRRLMRSLSLVIASVMVSSNWSVSVIDGMVSIRSPWISAMPV